jgi:membrane protein YqaA with SNARE-associated domain
MTELPGLDNSPHATGVGTQDPARPRQRRLHVPNWHIHRRLYDWMLSYAHKPSSTWALFWFSFAEASFFPIPPDVLMVPMCLERRARTWFYTTVATIGSVIGGLAGYGIGLLALHYDWIHKAMVWMFTEQGVQSAQKHLPNLWVITLATVVFHPYKLLTIAAGYFQSPILVFLLGSFIGRGVRFLLVGSLVYWFGPAVKEKIDRYFHALSIILILLIIGAVVFVRVYGKHGSGG